MRRPKPEQTRLQRALRRKKVSNEKKKPLQTLVQSTSQNRESRLWIGQYIAVFLPQGGADDVGPYDQLLFSVLRRLLRTFDRVSIRCYFLSLQPQPKLFSNSRNERVLRQSIERRNRARKRHWSPIQVEIVTSLQSGSVDHRRA